MIIQYFIYGFIFINEFIFCMMHCTTFHFPSDMSKFIVGSTFLLK